MPRCSRLGTWIENIVVHGLQVTRYLDEQEDNPDQDGVDATEEAEADLVDADEEHSAAA